MLWNYFWFLAVEEIIQLSGTSVSEIRIKVSTQAVGPWPYAMFFKENGRQINHTGSSCSERRVLFYILLFRCSYSVIF